MKLIQELLRRSHKKHYLSEGDMQEVARLFRVPLYRIQELVSFFPHFRTEPPPPVQVSVCRDMSCRLRNAEGICEKLRTEFDATEVEVREVSCLGRCDRAPAAFVNDEHLYAGRKSQEIVEIVNSYQQGSPVEPDADASCTTGNRDDWLIDPYAKADDRYAGVREYLKDADPKTVIESLETAGLLGMGGAGGRAYKKWSDVLKAKGSPKYVVCNADESEPGTFKDRELMLRAPHLLVEGMILGGLVTGAIEGFVYIRHEYHECIDSMNKEIQRAVDLGVCGEGICGTGRSFDLSVFASPGGYICGEQTALIEAMESKRAQPRNRPPQLQTNGLFDKPTLLNNVETFCWVPNIVVKDAGNWFASAGSKPQFKGRRFFSISGDVNRPGAFEVPNGVTVGELIEDYAGGIRGGNQLKAIALSGPSGGFTPAKVPTKYLGKPFLEDMEHEGPTFDIRQFPMEIGASRKSARGKPGIMLGAGIVVYDHTRDMVDQAWACSRFFHDESCGKCVPCRLGSHKIVEMANDLRQRNKQKTAADLLPIVDVLSETMKVTSICGLGTVAANPFTTLLRYFEDDIVEHLK